MPPAPPRRRRAAGWAGREAQPEEQADHGNHEAPRGEQASYDEVRLKVRSTPTDVVQFSDEWIYALADIEGEAVARSDGTTSTFRATKAWLLHRLPPGEWRLARHIWNMRP